MAEVYARIAMVVVRTVTVTRALLKQCRVFTGIPPKPYYDGDSVLAEYAVGWFRGTVLGDDDHDYVLFAKEGDLVLGKFWRSMQRWKLPKEVKQLYI